MVREKLSISHREIISEHLKSTEHPLSEYCFTNLYFFRKTHDYYLIHNGDCLYLEGKSYDHRKFLMPLQIPPATGTPCTSSLLEFFQQQEFDMFFPVPEIWLERFPEELFDREVIEDDSDYLYKIGDLASLAGKKRHKKRNLRNQFEGAYDYRIETLGPENLADAVTILDLWKSEKDTVVDVDDYLPCKESLENWEEFGLEGCIVYADGKPAGFAAGEEIGIKTFTIHFAKADIRYKGIYAFLFSRLSGILEDRFDWINMEQDLGSPGLRKTKRSYRPEFLAHKYRLIPKKPLS